MKRKAPWIAAIAFTAFSAGAIAVDNDSSRAARNAMEEGLPGPIANDPRLSREDAEASDSRVVSRHDAQATDSRVTSSNESRASGRRTSSSDRAAAIQPSFAMADRDGNGVLDAAEANAAGINFAAANADSDGFISMSEYYVALEQMGGRHARDRG